jgi:hypothetical protein
MRIATNPVCAAMMSTSGGWLSQLTGERGGTHRHAAGAVNHEARTTAIGVQPSVSHRRQRFHGGGEFMTGLMG